jgi:hypothetical protein
LKTHQSDKPAQDDRFPVINRKRSSFLFVESI